MTSIRSHERFDDFAPENPDGTVDYEYHGFNYVIAVGQRLFDVRTYDDEPGVASVIRPIDALNQPEARALAEFIVSEMGCASVQFYREPPGTFRPVDVRTLEFTET